MSVVGKCYKADCEHNLNGIYCECDEIDIDENGCCTCYFPKKSEGADDE